MKLNWKVRIKKKSFWFAIIPAVLLLVQQIGGVFGCEIPVEGLEKQLLAITSTIFSILVVFGIVTDPTTKGLGDSKQALKYKKPKKDVA